MKQVPKSACSVVLTSRISKGFRWDNYVDIVGVTGSIPVTPTIQVLEKLRKTGKHNSENEVLRRFNEPA